MTSDDLLTKILASNFTKSQAVAALSSFSAAANKALFKGKNTEEYEGLKRDEAEKILEETAKKLANMEPLFITLAVQLPEEKLANLGAKIRQVYGRDFLFETAVNPTLLGGAQLVWKGRMLDLSLKNKLETSRPQILEICQKYLA